MNLINSTSYSIKKSKFIAYYYEINNPLEVKPIITDLKLKHKGCKHLPYAYQIDKLVRCSDDKEPPKTAGLPILNVITQNQLNWCLIVIVRYFGGIKLGPGGLMRAYHQAAQEVIKKAN